MSGREEQEFYAATVEEALDRAAATLGTSREQLEFKVLDVGSAGFLGIGARDARVLVSGEQRSSAARASESSQERESRRTEGTIQGTEPTATEEVEEQPAVLDEAGERLIVRVDEYMTSLLEAMGLDATLDVYDAGDVIAVEVTTREKGLFIGQKGETVDAIQYLLNIAIYRDQPFVKRIILDSEGYRQRRIEAIQGMAHRTARRAVREKRALRLPPMSAAERRVVHLFLKENPSVTTVSEGSEADRKVVVKPL